MHRLPWRESPDAVVSSGQLDALAVNHHGKVVVVENNNREGHNAAGYHVVLIENLCGNGIQEERLNGNRNALAGQPGSVCLRWADAPRSRLVAGQSRRKQQSECH